MTAQLIVRIACDAPDCPRKITVPTRGVHVARAAIAKISGWKYQGRQDLCPNHQTQEKAEAE